MQETTRVAVTEGKWDNDLKSLYQLLEPHNVSEMCLDSKFCNIFSSTVAENVNFTIFLLNGGLR